MTSFVSNAHLEFFTLELIFLVQSVYLCVYEGPQQFDPFLTKYDYPLRPPTT